MSNDRGIDSDPLTDPQRLAALYRLKAPDAAAGRELDALTTLAGMMFDVPMATVHLLDDQHQIVKSVYGEARRADRPDGVRDGHPGRLHHRRHRSADRPAIPGSRPAVSRRRHPLLRRAPLKTREGQAVGTLCLLDTRRRAPLTQHQHRLLQQLADTAICLMEQRQSRKADQRSLMRALEEDALTGLVNRRGLTLPL